MDYELLDQAYETVRKAFPAAAPQCGLILGSGWSDVAEAFDLREALPYESIPGLGRTGVVGHAGRLLWAEASGVETLLFQGRRHWYEGEGWTPVALPIYLLKKFGVSQVFLTNAAGGVRFGFKPGDLMIISDHINNMPSNPLLGPHHECWGPRFPDQSQVYDIELSDLLAEAALNTGTAIHRGVYLASSGPAYETPAEVQAYKSLGADAVGMSTVPEALLANAAGLRVAGLSCITNFAAGISETALSHEEVTETTRLAMPKMKDVLLKTWEFLS